QRCQLTRRSPRTWKTHARRGRQQPRAEIDPRLDGEVFSVPYAYRRSLSSQERFIPVPCANFQRPSHRSARLFYEMSLTKEKKSELIGKYGRGDKDTGSAEVQVARTTER